MTVIPATQAEFDAVMQLLSEARRWHREKGVDEWRPFDPARIAADISAGRVFVAKIGESVCGTVTLVESDPLVWEGDPADALYVHKLVSSRALQGQGIGTRLLRWAQTLARQNGKRCLRLDTWDGNRRMREYYEQQGFRHVKDRFFPADSPLPADYRGTRKSLYQLDLEPRG